MFKTIFPNQHWKQNTVGTLQICAECSWIDFHYVSSSDLSILCQAHKAGSQEQVRALWSWSELSKHRVGMDGHRQGYMSEKTSVLGSMPGLFFPPLSLVKAQAPLGLCPNDPGHAQSCTPLALFWQDLSELVSEPTHNHPFWMTTQTCNLNFISILSLNYLWLVTNKCQKLIQNGQQKSASGFRCGLIQGSRPMLCFSVWLPSTLASFSDWLSFTLQPLPMS